MSTILVTGAAGFVGRHLIETLRARYPDARLCLLDHPTSGICSSGATLEEEGNDLRLSVDLTCRDDIPAAIQTLAERVGPPEIVFHLAAQAEVGRSFQAPSDTYAVNVVGTARLLEAISNVTLRARVLIPSSAQVYRTPEAGPSAAEGATSARLQPPLLDESTPIGPSSHYGVSKFAQEEVGRLFFETGGLPVFITRAFNHIGPGQQSGFVIPDFARQIAAAERQQAPAVPTAADPRAGQAAQTAAAEGSAAVAQGEAAAAQPQPASVQPGPAAAREPAAIKVGNLEARRDYLDVRDVVDAYLTVLEKGRPGLLYNVASGRTWSTRELLDQLLSLAQAELQVEVDPKLLRPLDVPVLAGDASRLRALGWSPTHQIGDTLRETLEYWRRMMGARIERSSVR